MSSKKGNSSVINHTSKPVVFVIHKGPTFQKNRSWKVFFKGHGNEFSKSLYVQPINLTGRIV